MDCQTHRVESRSKVRLVISCRHDGLHDDLAFTITNLLHSKPLGILRICRRRPVENYHEEGKDEAVGPVSSTGLQGD